MAEKIVNNYERKVEIFSTYCMIVRNEEDHPLLVVTGPLLVGIDDEDLRDIAGIITRVCFVAKEND
jgi:hypothetical protein